MDQHFSDIPMNDVVHVQIVDTFEYLSEEAFDCVTQLARKSSDYSRLHYLP